MKTTFQAGTAAPVLRRLARTANGSYSGVLIETGDAGVSLTATTGAIEVRAGLEASVADPGRVVLAAKLLADLAGACDPKAGITIKVANGDVTLTTGRTKVGLRDIGTELFPHIADPEVRAKADYEASEVLGAAARVVAMTTDDPLQPALGSVYVTADGASLRLVATDAFALGVSDLPGVDPLGSGALVPAEAIATVSRWMSPPEGRIEVSLGARSV
ncbi:MAG: hypothetical protein ACRD0J_05750, partial [Acidimicrobiales bacterium]